MIIMKFDHVKLGYVNVLWVLLLSSCSVVERIQNKSKMTPDAEVQQQTLPKKESIDYAKRRDLIALQNMFKKQQLELSQLREQLLQAKLKNDEFQKMMLQNFQLLERAVAQRQREVMDVGKGDLLTEPQQPTSMQKPLVSKKNADHTKAAD